MIWGYRGILIEWFFVLIEFFSVLIESVLVLIESVLAHKCDRCCDYEF